jgi:hypothetical protein
MIGKMPVNLIWLKQPPLELGIAQDRNRSKLRSLQRF